MWDLDGIMARWQKSKGTTIVCCGTKESDWHSVAQIASRYENVVPCFGVHPWFVEDVSARWFANLESFLEKEFAGRGALMGEIGVDHLLKNVDQTKQEMIFKTQMGMAKELGIPVSIHVRKGWDTLIRIFKKMAPLKAGGIIHSYSGSADMVPLLEKYGLYISFSGSVTHPGNKKVKKSLKAVSPHRLLIETDSPAILPRYPVQIEIDGSAPDAAPYSEPSLLPDKQHLQEPRLWPDAAPHSEPSLLLNRNRAPNPSEFTPSAKLYEMGWNEPCNIFLVALAVSGTLGTTISEVAHRTAINGEELFLSYGLKRAR